METRYEIFGVKDAVYRLKDAIENSDGNVVNVLKNLGLEPRDFGDSELLDSIQWRVLDVTDFCDTNESELDFEETCPGKYSNIIDRLVCDEDIFADKIIRVARYRKSFIKTEDDKPLPSGVRRLKGMIWKGRIIFKKDSI